MIFLHSLHLSDYFATSMCPKFVTILPRLVASVWALPQHEFCVQRCSSSYSSSSSGECLVPTEPEFMIRRLSTPRKPLKGTKNTNACMLHLLLTSGIEFFSVRKVASCKWTLLGHIVCRDAWAILLKVSKKKVARFLVALSEGAMEPPPDMRLGKNRPRAGNTSAINSADAYLAWVWSELAEPLAETCTGQKRSTEEKLQWWADGVNPTVYDEVRFLNPGCVEELYTNYECVSADPCSKRSFYRAWNAWKKRLRFRQPRQHARCSECARLTEQIKTATALEEKDAAKKALKHHVNVVVADRRLDHHLDALVELPISHGLATNLLKLDQLQCSDSQR